MSFSRDCQHAHIDRHSGRFDLDERIALAASSKTASTGSPARPFAPLHPRRFILPPLPPASMPSARCPRLIRSTVIAGEGLSSTSTARPPPSPLARPCLNPYLSAMQWVPSAGAPLRALAAPTPRVTPAAVQKNSAPLRHRFFELGPLFFWVLLFGGLPSFVVVFFLWVVRLRLLLRY